MTKRTIICRFDTKQALDEFNKKLGLNLSNMTRDYDFSTFEEKQRQKEPKQFSYSSDYLEKQAIWESNSMPYYNSFDEEVVATINFNLLLMNCHFYLISLFQIKLNQSECLN